MQLLFERSVELGYRAVVLSSQVGQAQAHRLYERIGFRRTPDLDWEPAPAMSWWRI